jgi:hypothetical protein
MNEQIREGFIDATPLPQEPQPPRRVEVREIVEPPAPPPPQEPAEERDFRESWPVTVKLRRPIVGMKRDELLHELTFREPTGRDINTCGNPVRIDSNGEIQVDEKKMTNMMAQLSGVLPPLLQGMHPVDWNSCYYRLRPFFLPDPRSW